MASIGPITIFDKSALESLNPDEALWFDWFYKTIITPLFYVETLADLTSTTCRSAWCSYRVISSTGLRHRIFLATIRLSFGRLT